MYNFKWGDVMQYRYLLIFGLLLTSSLAYDRVVKNCREYFIVYSSQDEQTIKNDYSMPDYGNIRIIRAEFRNRGLYLNWKMQVIRDRNLICDMSFRDGFRYEIGIQEILGEVIEITKTRFLNLFGRPDIIRNYELEDSLENRCYDWDTEEWGSC